MKDKLAHWYLKILEWAKDPENSTDIKILNDLKFPEYKFIENRNIRHSKKIFYAHVVEEIKLALKLNPKEIFLKHHFSYWTSLPEKYLLDSVITAVEMENKKYYELSRHFLEVLCIDIIKNIEIDVEEGILKTIPESIFLKFINDSTLLSSNVVSLSEIKDPILRFDVATSKKFPLLDREAAVIYYRTKAIQSKRLKAFLSRLLHQKDRDQTSEASRLIELLKTEKELDANMQSLQSMFSNPGYYIHRKTRLKIMKIVAVTLALGFIGGIFVAIETNAENIKHKREDMTPLWCIAAFSISALASMVIFKLAESKEKHAEYLEKLNIF